MTQKIIKVFVVEDSPVAQELLVHMLNSDPLLRVIGTAANGAEALEFLARQKPENKPDVITMDIHMPKMDGYEATRRIMETQPVPIVVVSASWEPEEVNKTFRALEAGAVAVLEKPHGPGHPEHEALTQKLLQTIKAMAEVKVVRRWPRKTEPAKSEIRMSKSETKEATRAGIKVVAIGISTGGPPVLQTILSGLPKDFAAPILIVQHITAGFLPGLAEWLQQTTGFATHIATHGEPLLSGHAYLAPDGSHLGIEKGGHIELSASAPENGLRPAASFLFRSVAGVFGANVVGVLLTGMGRDGAEELKLLKDKGALTIAQDKESSVVHGMPGEAIKLDAATYVLSPEKIAATLASIVGKKEGA